MPISHNVPLAGIIIGELSTEDWKSTAKELGRIAVSSNL